MKHNIPLDRIEKTGEASERFSRMFTIAIKRCQDEREAYVMARALGLVQ